MHYTPFYAVSPQDEHIPSQRQQSPPSELLPTSSTKPITCMVYIGQPSNPQFLRNPDERHPASVAEVISQGVGQSGRNPEYLYLLEKALEGLGLGLADGHVTDLVRRVKIIEGLHDRKDKADEEEENAEREVERNVAGGGGTVDVIE